MSASGTRLNGICEQSNWCSSRSWALACGHQLGKSGVVVPEVAPYSYCDVLEQSGVELVCVGVKEAAWQQAIKGAGLEGDARAVPVQQAGGHKSLQACSGQGTCCSCNAIQLQHAQHPGAFSPATGPATTHQCAAVSTYWGSIKVPPQMWPPSVPLMEDMYG